MTRSPSDSGTPPLLRIVDASVRKGAGAGHTILDSVNLEIADGEHAAILGPNGSGKSSLIRLITREYYPVHCDGQAPSVQIFGKSTWDVFELRSMLGIVTPHLDREFADEGKTHLHAHEAVLSGYFATRGVHRYQEITSSMRDRAAALLERMDAAHLAQKPLHEMSTGEVRRVLIARALVPNPRALLLDEPTTGLDMVATRHFLLTISGLAQAGKTILLVTHHLHEILPEIRRVILLKDGCIYRDGPKNDVLTSGNLSGAFEAPLEVRRHGSGYFSMDTTEAAPSSKR